MKRFLILAYASSIGASMAQAGGLDRSGQNIAALFENGGASGSYVELSFGNISPDISGTAIGTASGNIADSYFRFGGAYKTDLNDRITVALIYDQPYGADVAYPTGTGYPFAGATAQFESNALTGILQYNFDTGVSIYGGLRAQQISAKVSIPAVASYTADGPSETAFGYLLGAAYEKPEIGLRVALTYFSSTSHDMTVTETSLATGTTTSPYEQKMPQAINLDFQTGVAADTLVFGGVRWVDWSDFTIAPPVYAGPLVGRPLVFYNGDYVTYTLGVGRKFSDTWSGSVALTYEPGVGGYTTNLGPHDGLFGVTVGMKYTKDNLSVTGGVNMSWLGDASSVVNSSPFLTSSFTDNTSIGFGLRVGYAF